MAATAGVSARRGRGLPAALVHTVTPGRALAIGVATTLCFLTFTARGGAAVEPLTWASVLLLLAGAVLAATALAAPDRFATVSPLHGGAALAGLVALTFLTALSILWSLAPDDSWLDANRLLGLLGAFAGGLALSRLVPHLWAGMLAGLALGCLLISTWALLTKVAPELLAETERFARLRAPFDYWNAVGLMAALGVPPFLWLAARRSGHAALNGLAYPALGLLFVCLMLSYSRGALLALLVGVAIWLVAVPLRLRSVVALLVSGTAAGLVVAWSFRQPGLTEDRLPLAIRSDAGHELGVLLSLMTVLLLAAGLAIGFFSSYRPPSRRQRVLAGRVIVGGLGAAVVLWVAALATSGQGIGDRVTSAYQQLTSAEAQAPENSPDRLTATSSVRSRYWREALDVHATAPWVGVGADAYATARKRHRRSRLDVEHAHGYVVQTLADLGWAGLLVSLATLAAWLWAAAATLGWRRRDRGLPWDAERVGVSALAVVAVVFGVHSTIDWTWYVLGNAVAGMLCAGWVAGRGPLRGRLRTGGTGQVGRRRPHAGLPWRARLRAWNPDPYRTAMAAGVLIIAMAAAWTVVQPLRAMRTTDAAAASAANGSFDEAARLAREASSQNPLSVDPLFELAAIHSAAGRPQAAHDALEDAVALQPANDEAWRRLGRFRLDFLDDPEAALEAFRVAFYLDPLSPEATSDVLEVSRMQVTP